jgi:hypothetical protein
MKKSSASRQTLKITGKPLVDWIEGATQPSLWGLNEFYFRILFILSDSSPQDQSKFTM